MNTSSARGLSLSIFVRCRLKETVVQTRLYIELKILGILEVPISLVSTLNQETIKGIRTEGRSDYAT